MLLSLLERDPEQLPALMKAVHPHTGKAYCVGITGPPGAGKSTLVDGLIEVLRNHGSAVGVLAVDPTSTFTGGAVLGDRIRMNRHSLDQGVFIRSLATRGARGGLSGIAGAAVRLLDAYGSDVVLVESVGVGQTELDVMNVADTVVVTLVPEAGDSVQVLKAGLVEIADIFVVNKSDRRGANRLVTAIKDEVEAREHAAWWRPPVLLTQAHRGVGLAELHQAIVDHRAEGERSSRLEHRRSERRKREFTRAVMGLVEARIAELGLRAGESADIVQRVESGDVDPYSAAAEAVGDGRLFGLNAVQ